MARIDYTRIDVGDFLRELGIQNVQDQGSEVAYSCPFPGHSHGDSSPSATMEKGTTRAHCFGCGWSGNARGFLTDFENISPLEAARRLRQRWGSAADVAEGEVSTHVGRIIDKITQRRPVQGLPILSEEEQYKREIDWNAANTALALGREVAEPLSYMLVDRGFHWQTLESWGVGYDDISQRVTLPARDADGNLVGFKGRAWHPSIVPKYKVLGGAEYGFEPYEVSRILFGLHRVREENDWEPLVVCEGELNAIALEQKGFGRVVGISGKTLSAEQCALIRTFANQVDLMFDEEEDAERAAMKLRRYMPVFVVPNPYGHDGAEATFEELEERFKAAVSVTV